MGHEPLSVGLIYVTGFYTCRKDTHTRDFSTAKIRPQEDFASGEEVEFFIYLGLEVHAPGTVCYKMIDESPFPVSSAKTGNTCRC